MKLNPGEVENKYYRRGVGFILGVIVKGGDERTELVPNCGSPRSEGMGVASDACFRPSSTLSDRTFRS